MIVSRRLQLISYCARAALAVVFIWHGLVPKLLWLSADEVAMIEAHGFPAPAMVAAISGVLEIIMGVAILVYQRNHWPLMLAGSILIALLVDVALFSPHLLIQAFNPVSLNLAAIALCIIAALAQVPGAKAT